MGMRDEEKSRVNPIRRILNPDGKIDCSLSRESASKISASNLKYNCLDLEQDSEEYKYKFEAKILVTGSLDNKSSIFS
jgi:hypothetical protein